MGSHAGKSRFGVDGRGCDASVLSCFTFTQESMWWQVHRGGCQDKECIPEHRPHGSVASKAGSSDEEGRRLSLPSAQNSPKQLPGVKAVSLWLVHVLASSRNQLCCGDGPIVGIFTRPKKLPVVLKGRPGLTLIRCKLAALRSRRSGRSQGGRRHMQNSLVHIKLVLGPSVLNTGKISDPRSEQFLGV